MKENKHLNAPSNHADLPRGINRREMVRRLVMAGGAGLALPGITEGDPAVGPLADQAATAQANVKTAKGDWIPLFLDQHQSATLAVLAERIIPGSSQAQVNRFIDLLLSVDTQDAQKDFVASLSAFEADALRRFSHPYKDLTDIQQNEILAAASTAEHGKVEEGKSHGATMCDHFENIKRWVGDAYYSSEAGMKELGWTGQVFFTSFPGCQNSGISS